MAGAQCGCMGGGFAMSSMGMRNAMPVATMSISRCAPTAGYGYGGYGGALGGY